MLAKTPQKSCENSSFSTGGWRNKLDMVVPFETRQMGAGQKQVPRMEPWYMKSIFWWFNFDPYPNES